MRKKYSIRAIIKYIFLFGFICYSCKDNQSKKNKSQEIVISPRISENFRVLEGNRYLDFKLPDTISLKDSIKGYIVYKSKFDTIKKTSKTTHFVDLYFANTDKLSKDFSEFQTKKSDTFARIHDSLFVIYGIKFNKRGNHSLEGYIKDYLYEEVSPDSVRFRTIEDHILYEIYVK
ncbi:Lipoprotein [Zobellia nedashkovskayae]